MSAYFLLQAAVTRPEDALPHPMYRVSERCSLA